MSTIADFRASGLTFTLKPGDAIGVTGFTPQNERLKSSLVERKTDIVGALKYEAQHGLPLEYMALYSHLSRLFDWWSAVAICEERTAALGLIRRWHNALTENIAAGCRLVITEQSQLEVLAANRILEGPALHSVVKLMAEATSIDVGLLGPVAAQDGPAVVDMGVLG